MADLQTARRAVDEARRELAELTAWWNSGTMRALDALIVAVDELVTRAEQEDA